MTSLPQSGCFRCITLNLFVISRLKSFSDAEYRLFLLTLSHERFSREMVDNCAKYAFLLIRCKIVQNLVN